MINYNLLFKLTHDVPDGLDHTIKKEPVTKAIREAIHCRDGFKCAMCSSMYSGYAVYPRTDDYQPGVHIHHIIPNGSATPDNLITLCEKCHDLTHLLLYIDKKWNVPPTNIILLRNKVRKTRAVGARERYRTGEKAFTRTEINKLLAACATLEDELLLKLGVSLGLRREDMVNVKVVDVDLTNNALSYYERKKSRLRVVPIGGNVSQLILKYMHTIPRSQKSLFAFSGSTAYRKLQRLCDLTGVPRRPFHALRSTCVKFCQAEGWPIEAVSELTGDSIRVIQEHYLTPSHAELHELATGKEVI